MNATQVEAKRWFHQAQSDLAVTRTLKSAKHYVASCFHSQQAAEKVLKALLYSQRHRVVLGHSVRELARQCEVYNPAFAGIAEETVLLDKFYIPTPYPNGLPSPAVPGESYTALQAEAALKGTKRVLGVVEKFLGANT